MVASLSIVHWKSLAIVAAYLIQSMDFLTTELYGKSTNHGPFVRQGQVSWDN